MAPETEGLDREYGMDDKGAEHSSNGQLRPEKEEEDEEEDEDEEPRLKYAILTKGLKPVYRNGDSTSTFLVAGDKMIVGTHNGNIHVLALPSLKSIRVYHAHSASISTLSVSPFPPPLPTAKGDAVGRIASEHRASSDKSSLNINTTSPSSRSPKQPPVPLTPSNAIHIASSSIDGNVCVTSLTDPKDVALRDFGRPVQAVALSPMYKSDRSYLSGGLAGNLILTTGVTPGRSSAAGIAGGAAMQVPGWLNTIGLGSSTGKDTVLHRGEGAISTIKWSLSGKYVAWVNEQGIKFIRTNLLLESAETEFSWKRFGHVDHPNLPGWEEMSGVWKAHIEWIDEAGLETDDFNTKTSNGSRGISENQQSGAGADFKISSKRTEYEKLVIGWSGTIWMINVYPGSRGVGKEKKIGRLDIVTILRTDCIISGISLYTPSLLLVLAYITPEEGSSSVQTFPRRGRRRQNALQPEMRIIDINTKEEVCVADTLNMSRFENLSATDYHLGVLPALHVPSKTTTQRGALEVIGGGIWDATMYSTRLFGSAASVRSIGSPSGSRAPSDANTATSLTPAREDDLLHPSAFTHGLKIFIQSPYDCVLATKPSAADSYSWLVTHDKYEEAWNLLCQHPEAAGSQSESTLNSSSSTPTKVKGSLEDFFADDGSQTTVSVAKNFNTQAEKEKRRIGEKWLQQLISAEAWSKAGQAAGQVLNTSSSWEHWVWVFAQASKYDEITPYIPTAHIRPPLPSMVYEIMLGHYIAIDRLRFKELLERWPPELYNAGSVIEAIKGRLKAGDIKEDSIENSITGRDWRILMEGLAKLYLADSRPRKALGCHIKLQNADAAMSLISENHLVDAISDDIPGFILLRVSKSQQKTAPLSDLEEATQEPIRLLVDEAHHGIVPPDTVISQLTNRYGVPNPYLFFYFRALWNGDTTTAAEETAHEQESSAALLGGSRAAEQTLAATEGKSLVSDFADDALLAFAEYDRALLMTFLKTSQSYTLQTASILCEQRNYIPELVYLLAKEGRTTQALCLIIDQLGDVSQAIAFAKEQNDQGLWDDLLDYSMSKPRFIRGLLEEVGTAINPVKLVRRIPAGLEIEGLREGLSRMIKEYEIQHSISSGVARVLRGEVAAAMAVRGAGQRKGIRFDVAPARTHHSTESHDTKKEKKKPHPLKPTPGHCAHCHLSYASSEDSHRQILIAFPCTHVFHLSCLLDSKSTVSQDQKALPDVISRLSNGEEEQEEQDEYDRSIGPKVDHAALLRGVVGEGCPLEGCGES